MSDGIKKISRRNFSHEEDAKLISLVGQFGTNNWKDVAAYMPGKTPRQIRERWNNYLRPNINNRPFTKEEDDLIWAKFNEIGPHWVVIANFLMRTNVQVKNRWSVLAVRKLKEASMDKTQKTISMPELIAKQEQEIQALSLKHQQERRELETRLIPNVVEEVEQQSVMPSISEQNDDRPSIFPKIVSAIEESKIMQDIGNIDMQELNDGLTTWDWR